jgi:hypothetical protein
LEQGELEAYHKQIRVQMEILELLVGPRTSVLLEHLVVTVASEVLVDRQDRHLVEHWEYSMGEVEVIVKQPQMQALEGQVLILVVEAVAARCK